MKMPQMNENTAAAIRTVRQALTEYQEDVRHAAGNFRFVIDHLKNKMRAESGMYETAIAEWKARITYCEQEMQDLKSKRSRLEAELKEVRLLFFILLNLLTSRPGHLVFFFLFT